MPLSRFSTLEDEKTAYRKWGWAWTADQEPAGPPNPPSSYVPILGPGQDVHGDFEGDDVWQNLLMFKRTGNAVYREMAAKWAEYYINHYEVDLKAGGNPDSAFGYDHLFGFGLLDWFAETGDPRALAAAIRLGELSLGNYRNDASLRKHARHLLLVTRLWEQTSEARWRAHMQRIRDDLMTTWPEVVGAPNAYDPQRGVWMIDRGVAGLHVTANAVHLGWLNWALARYYEATGGTDTVVRDRLIAMARFVQQYGLNPADGQSGCYIAFDTGSPVYIPNLHVCTTYWIDTLVRGYRLTDDRTLLDRAILHWQRGTDAPPGQVGRFMNRFWLSSTPFYVANGELSYAHLLFVDEAQAPGSPPPPPPAAAPNPGLNTLGDNEWRRLDPKPSSRYVPTNFTSTNVLSQQSWPVGRSYSGIHYGDGRLFYFGGGHGSYPGNDIEVYDIANNVWMQSYKPEVCALSDSRCNGIYGGWGVDTLTPLGRPYVEHTYQKMAWDPANKRLVGILSGGTFAFDPATAQWSRLADPLVGGDVFTWNLLGWDPDRGTVLGIVTDVGPTVDRGVYALTAGRWQWLAPVPQTDWSEAYSTYLPDQRLHFVYMMRWGSFWTFNARTLTWTKLVSTPPAALNIDSLDYDTRNRVVIGIQHAGGAFKVWAYTPATDTWTQVPTSGPVPAQSEGAGAMAPLLRYDPIHNVFIFLEGTAGGGGTGGATNTWAYRYRR